MDDRKRSQMEMSKCVREKSPNELIYLSYDSSASDSL